MIGYVALLLGTLPVALPLWTRVLQGSVGRFITVEQIHVVEYLGLGWLGAAWARTIKPPPWNALLSFVLVAGVGLLDESAQRWMPGRFFDWADVGLNLVGGIVGVACQRVMQKIARGRG